MEQHEERKTLTAGELKQMFQDPAFAWWANNLERRAEEFKEHEKKTPISARDRISVRYPRNEF